MNKKENFLSDYFAQTASVQITKTNQTSAIVEWSVPSAKNALGWTGQYRTIGEAFWITAPQVATFKSGTNYAWTASTLKPNTDYEVNNSI